MNFRLIGTFLGLSFLATNALAEDNSVVSMAKEKGVKRCIPQIEHISNFIIDKKAHGSHATWNKDAADNRMYSSLSSKGYTDGDSHVSVIASINSDGKCDTYYVETFALAKSCLMAREKTYKDMEFVGTLNDKTIVLKNAGGANYYLSPQGTANNICLVSKRETIYQ
ncbi:MULTISPECIES: hypothetical protein [Pseudoalteromonas]|uniref:Uncharacterized protein n=1 Tax=Pseudoalteromonas fuliginea TaxID=1872678 RepID=A0ABD3Y4E4_9GAMM|nr:MULTISPECIES: hypothetical protein [Pseudoalteromonas]KDC48920.1 hypothetical protein DC53_19050 [Pseudoalteromonas fuliginea]KJZ29507.1 hypothetical protein TW82_01935 [Pseudoalteromonas fuliginea]GAA81302.1 hypothetical protein P20495_3832 [Pseudoalteromonas sp. BSi20495]